MLKLKIIVGSIRPTRAADKVAPWVLDRASRHQAFDVELLDLRDWNLPIFAEHIGSLGDFSDPTFSAPVVRRWNKKIKEGDAYLVITPEYNHSIPGVLKNAIDSIFTTFAFRNKPIAAVAYSVGISGGVRAIEHLAQISIELEMAPVKCSVVIPFVNSAFDESGQPTSAVTNGALDLTLEDLAWWGHALQQARMAGELPPAVIRLQSAIGAVNSEGADDR